MFRIQAPARLTPTRINGTKMATSTICRARPDGEKPVVYIDTQIAKMISESVSDTIVAPIATITGAILTAPRRVTIGRLSRVCDASSEPMTMD